jgi:thymidylate kinase
MYKYSQIKKKIKNKKNNKMEYSWTSIIFAIIIFNIIFDIFLKIYMKKKNVKVIVIDGAIAVGKSTLIEYIHGYLTKLNYKVYYEEELILQDDFLKTFFYSDVENGSMSKYAFSLQDHISLKYQKFYDKIECIKKDYDYIIMDRSILSVKIFSELNIDDKTELEWLNKQCEEINKKFYYDFAFHVKLDNNTMINLQKERNKVRNMEKVEKEYLINLNNLYEKRFPELYELDKSHIVSTKHNLKEYENTILKEIYQIIK